MIKSHINQRFYKVIIIMLRRFLKKTKSYSHFLWLILLISITSFVTYFYNINKETQSENLNKTLRNVYLQKVIAKITSGLEDRYSEIEYIVKDGDILNFRFNT